MDGTAHQDTVEQESGSVSRSGRLSVASKVARDVIPPVAAAAIILLSWQMIVDFGVVSAVIIPPPSEVATAFFSMISTAMLWHAVGTTLSETLVGFLLGVGSGVLIGVAAVSFKAFQDIIFPYVVAFQNSPRVALAPMFLIWFGFGIESKIVMSAAICFYPVAINTLVGLASTDKDTSDLLTGLGASKWQRLIHSRVPAAAPLIFAGLKNSMALALIGAIVGEFVSAETGLGVLIQKFTFELSLDSAFSVLLILGAMGAILYSCLALVGNRVLYWVPKESGSRN